jgi:hypothetical protein
MKAMKTEGERNKADEKEHMPAEGPLNTCLQWLLGRALSLTRHIISFNPQTTHKVGIISWMRKLKFKKVNNLPSVTESGRATSPKSYMINYASQSGTGKTQPRPDMLGRS